jgi:cell division protein FtsB
MRALIAILVLTLGLLLMKMWLGEGGLRDVQRLEQRVQDQALENEALEQRNQQLRADVEDLRQGLQAVEERARSELGMIKENEQFYQVVPGKKTKKDDSG